MISLQGHHTEDGPHAKFTNYSFDKNEFVRLVAKAVEHVYRQDSFHQFIKQNKEDDNGEKLQHNEL